MDARIHRLQRQLGAGIEAAEPAGRPLQGEFQPGRPRRVARQGIARQHTILFAGLNIFAGKRLIDAGEPHKALAHFRQAWQLSPALTLRAWYKVVQAAGNTIGMDRLFLAYRTFRRSCN